MINDCRQIGSPLQAGLARLMGKAYCSSTDWEFNQQRHYREYHGSSVLLCELPPWQANYVVSAHESTRAEYDSSGESWNTSRTVSFYISCHQWTSTAVYEIDSHRCGECPDIVNKWVRWLYTLHSLVLTAGAGARRHCSQVGVCR